MAIAAMKKVLIASHRSEAGDFLEKLQGMGVMEVLNAEQALVSKEWPDLQSEALKPRDLEEMVGRLEKAVSFLEKYAADKGGVSPFSPLKEIESSNYTETVSGKDALNLLEKTENIQSSIEQLENELENCRGRYDWLLPWKDLSVPVEELTGLQKARCISGFVPYQHIDEVTEKIVEHGGAIEETGVTGSSHACLIICNYDTFGEINKVLRAADFDPVNFENLTGMVADLLEESKKRAEELESRLKSAKSTASELAGQRLVLKILYDHYNNFLERRWTENSAPSTENVILFEGWVKRNNFSLLEEAATGFKYTSVSEIPPAEDELPPVDIENKKAAESFEVITRLYGLPDPKNLDPTPFLAPFFAVFFGICLTDVGYGLLLGIIAWLIMRKFQGDKRAFVMVIICSVMAVIGGALTGSWFGDFFQNVIPEDTGLYNALNGMREKLMLFDPMKDPITFFVISLILGYVQVQFGLFIGFFHFLFRKEYAEAFFDKGVWIVFLNCLVIFALSKQGLLPGALSPVFMYICIAAALVILLFSERTAGWGGRIGMGMFGLFNTVFYFGDILSYVRLMALGMATAGLGMAINVLVKLVMDVPYVGWLLGALMFVGGHLVNLAMSVLSAFVHTLRLQFVEFFPKFYNSGGREFKPMRRKYKHVLVKE